MLNRRGLLRSALASLAGLAVPWRKRLADPELPNWWRADVEQAFTESLDAELARVLEKNTITVGGHTYTFVSHAFPNGSEIRIGGSVEETCRNAKPLLEKLAGVTVDEEGIHYEPPHYRASRSVPRFDITIDAPPRAEEAQP